MGSRSKFCVYHWRNKLGLRAGEARQLFGRPPRLLVTATRPRRDRYRKIRRKGKQCV